MTAQNKQRKLQEALQQTNYKIAKVSDHKRMLLADLAFTDTTLALLVAKRKSLSVSASEEVV